MSVTVTEAVAEWLCAARYEDFPVQAKIEATNVLLDSMGAIIACSAFPEVQAVVRLIEKLGGNAQSSVIGQSLKTSVVNAAMANGCMAHGAEADSVHLETVGGHVAAGVVPTALAVGEWLGRSSQEILRAIVLGYELGGRLMVIFCRERNPVVRRFYTTTVIAALSSAVTAGSLLALTRRQMQAALCLSAYQASGPDNTIKDDVHMSKTFMCGCANRNGVTAALLAADGCHVPLDVLDGAYSFFDAFLGMPDVGAEMVNDLGRHFAVTKVMYKRYPVGTPNQTYLQALFALLDRHHPQPDDIEEIKIEIPQLLVQRIPTTRHASISGLTVCAIAAVKGNLDFWTLHDPASASDPAVLAMQQRVKFVGREEWGWFEHGLHAIVTIQTRGGEQLREELWYSPMSRPELERKFRSLVEPILGAAKTVRLNQLLDDFSKADSVMPLMSELKSF